MPLRLSLLVLLTLLACLLGPPAVTADGPAGQPVLEPDAAGLTITWRPPDYAISTLTFESGSYSRFLMPYTTLSGQPGYPQLPVYSGLVGLPPTGGARLEVVELQTEIVNLSHPPEPAPQPVAVLDPLAGFSGGSQTHTPDPAVYAADSFYPGAVAELGEPQQVRSHRVAALTIYPLRVNAARQEMEVVRLVRLRVSFSHPAEAITALALPSGPDPVAAALSATLLNPEAGQWLTPPEPAQPDAGLNSLGSPAGAGAIKVWVNEAGLYGLTYDDLRGAGLPLESLDPRTLKLSHGYPRQEVAILVEGEADGRFDPPDRLLFYAWPSPSRYVAGDVYFLSYGGAGGLRMGLRPGAPAGLPAGTAWRVTTAETNKFYDPLYQARDGDYWYWDRLYQPDHPAENYNLPVQAPLAAGPAATLTVWLQGYTAHPSLNPDHRVQVYLNNYLLGTVEWDGKSANTATLAVPANTIISGDNQVRLVLPGISGVFAEGAWLDAFRLVYPVGQAGTGQSHFKGEAGQRQYIITGAGGPLLVFDVTVPESPRQVAGYTLNGSTLGVGDAGPTAADYLIVPANQIKRPLSLQPALNLADPAGGADYIIISHPSLLAALAPLAEHRARQGLRVATVDVSAVYDTFGDGRLDAGAIKNFLAHAYARWPAPAPLYVLLAGDGSYDFKNYSGYNPPRLLPPYLAPVDPWWGETAADNRLVTLAGADNLPDMLIGRLAVSSAAEAATVVDKIIQYEASPPAGDWATRQVIVADNPDPAADFYGSADKLYSQLPDSYPGTRYYYGGSGSSPAYFYSDPAVLRANLLNTFNQGASLVAFYGHSSWEQWAVESLLHLNDLGQLNNQNRLPVVLEMTCFTGFFHHPKTTTFDESLLRRPGGGAVAVWGSTGLGVSTGHDQLQAGFYEAVMQAGQPVLGSAILAGKLNLFATGFHQDLLDTFTLFGDPALNLGQVFKPDVRITQAVTGSGHRPGDPISLTLTIRSTGAGPARGLVVTDTLPAAILSPSWSTTAPGVSAGGLYTWTLPDLASGQEIIITISGVIDPALPPDFSFTNTARVTSSAPELSDGNNTSIAVIGGRRLYLPTVMRNY